MLHNFSNLLNGFHNRMSVRERWKIIWQTRSGGAQKHVTQSTPCLEGGGTLDVCHIQWALKIPRFVLDSENAKQSLTEYKRFERIHMRSVYRQTWAHSFDRKSINQWRGKFFKDHRQIIVIWKQTKFNFSRMKIPTEDSTLSAVHKCRLIDDISRDTQEEPESQSCRLKPQQNSISALSTRRLWSRRKPIVHEASFNCCLRLLIDLAWNELHSELVCLSTSDCPQIEPFVCLLWLSCYAKVLDINIIFLLFFSLFMSFAPRAPLPSFPQLSFMSI